MEAIHGLITSVIDNVAPAFKDADLPPEAVEELKELWIDKLQAQGLFEEGPSPFPVQKLTRATIDRARRHLKSKKAPPPRLAQPRLAAPGGQRALTLVPPPTGAAALVPWTREGEDASDFGRPQAARARPAPAIPPRATGAFEIMSQRQSERERTS
jgi:hypothetical protein